MIYRKLFDSLSGSVGGKILAATIIGALAGLAAARKVSGSGQLGWWWIAGGGGAIGFVGGLLLGLAEIREKRIAAGTSKPLSGKVRLMLVAGVIVAFFAVCLVIVFGPSFQLSSNTPRPRPEFATPEAEALEGNPLQSPESDSMPPPTRVGPPAEATSVTPGTPDFPPPVPETVDRQPQPTTAPMVAKISPPAVTPPEPSTQSEPPANPAAPRRVKPAVASTVQSVAGKWKLSRSVSVTLLADGTLKTNYGDMRNGKWTLTDGKTVTIYTSKGVDVYSFRLDEKGTAGLGNWKDGSKASPIKTD